MESEVKNSNGIHPITVILPVYNTGRYLTRCLDSVLGQTFSDFELLAIDDGSSDGSASILDEYASVEPRMRVIHLPENHGVPYARNLAMDEAKGEYIYFMDSDDWIDPDYLEKMYAMAEKTGQDVVINCNWYEEYEDGTPRMRSGDFGFIKKEDGYYSPVSVQSAFYPVVWLRLYRLNYLRDNNIRSPLLKGGVEDNYFTGLAEILQEKSYIFHGPFYHYCQREGSLVRQPDAAFHHMENFRLFLDTLHERGISPNSARRYYIPESLTIDSKDRFVFLKSFSEDVYPDVEAAQELYNPFDAFLIKILCSCEDYDNYRSIYSSLPHLSFLAINIRNKIYPSVGQILNGTYRMR